VLVSGVGGGEVGVAAAGSATKTSVPDPSRERANVVVAKMCHDAGSFDAAPLAAKRTSSYVVALTQLTEANAPE
jgi:hypothetical protein